MSILDKIKLTKLEEVSKLNKDKLEYDRLNFLKSSQNSESFENSLNKLENSNYCLLYTSPSPRDRIASRMPSSA